MVTDIRDLRARLCKRLRRTGIDSSSLFILAGRLLYRPARLAIDSEAPLQVRAQLICEFARAFFKYSLRKVIKFGEVVASTLAKIQILNGEQIKHGVLLLYTKIQHGVRGAAAFYNDLVMEISPMWGASTTKDTLYLSQKRRLREKKCE